MVAGQGGEEPPFRSVELGRPSRKVGALSRPICLRSILDFAAGIALRRTLLSLTLTLKYEDVPESGIRPRPSRRLWYTVCE